MKLAQADLNLLVVLDVLLREKNVTRAAESLCMSQPATSAALARLRRMLGDELLHKNGRHLELTSRGAALVEPIRDVLATLEHTILRAPVFDPTTDARCFSVVSSDYAGTELLSPVLARMAALNAGVRLDAVPVSSRYLDVLRGDEVDIAILPDLIVEGEAMLECPRLPLLVDRFVGAVWSRHPSAGDHLTPELLASVPYLEYRGAGRRSVIEDQLDAVGLARRTAATATSFFAMPFMLTGTELVAVVPERVARRVVPAADIRILEPRLGLRPLCQSAYWHPRRDRDPGHRWLRTQLAAAAEKTRLTTLLPPADDAG